MVSLRSLTRPEVLPLVEGDGVYLRGPHMGDYEEWAQLRECSRSFLMPWEAVWPEDDLTRPAFRRRLRKYMRNVREETAYPFFVFEKHADALVGGCTLSGVCRGVQQCGDLGYWIGEPFAGKGYGTEAVKVLTCFSFRELGLHRIQAACIPSNERSKAVLRKCGFREEGYARSYLKINGRWQDHVLFGLLQGDV